MLITKLLLVAWNHWIFSIVHYVKKRADASLLLPTKKWYIWMYGKEFGYTCAFVNFTFWSMACCWEISFCRFSLENRLNHRSLREFVFISNEPVSASSLFSFWFCSSLWSIISSHDFDFLKRLNRGNGLIRITEATFCLVFSRTWSLGWRKR